MVILVLPRVLLLYWTPPRPKRRIEQNTKCNFTHLIWTKTTWFQSCMYVATAVILPQSSLSSLLGPLLGIDEVCCQFVEVLLEQPIR